MREHAVATVEPAIRAPDERVERFVRVFVGPAIEQHFRLAIRNVVAVLIGDEQQIRRRADEHAAEADFDAADQIQVLGEHLALVEFAVAIGVFENQNAVACPCPSGARIGYSYASATHSRPRSSIAIAIGCFTSGSAAESLTEKPSGSFITLTASSPGNPA